MKTYINPNITIALPTLNKSRHYFIVKDEVKLKDGLVIKCRGSKGESRGCVGKILKDGTIETPNSVYKLITPEIKKKINFAIELLFNPKQPFAIKA